MTIPIHPQDLDRTHLVTQWAQTFHCPAPRHAQTRFLHLALAWHTQMQASDTWRGAIGVTRLSRSLRQTAPLITLAPGTRLVREWQGHTHHVTVLPQGFDYQGTHFKSLSAIARAITGTPWSGPQFFGLKP